MKATELIEKIEDVSEKVLKPGTRVKVMRGGSGLDSDKEGVVIEWSKVPTKQTGGGIVADLPGEYKPISDLRGKGWVPVKTDDGEIFTMPKNHLIKV